MSTVAALSNLLSIIDSWTGNDFDVRSVKADCLMEIARLEGDYSEKINLTVISIVFHCFFFVNNFHLTVSVEISDKKAIKIGGFDFGL